MRLAHEAVDGGETGGEDDVARTADHRQGPAGGGGTSRHPGEPPEVGLLPG